MTEEKCEGKESAGLTENDKVQSIQFKNPFKEEKPVADPVESYIGAIGPWQILVCLTVMAVKFGVAFHQMNIIFLAPPSKYTCKDPDSETTRCSGNCSSYEYDRSVFGSTIITDWDLICKREWMKDFTQTIFMLGILIGNMVFGFFADRFGRRWPLLAAVIIQGLSGVAAALAPDWYSFTALRFLVAFSTGGTMVTSFVIIMEVVGVRYREMVGILFQIPFILGHLSLVGIAFLSRASWRTLQLWVSLPSFLLISYYWLVPESPRWLLAMGRLEEATSVLEKAAKMNKLEIENIGKSIQEASDQLGHDNEPKENMVSLFRNSNLRMKTFCINFNWLACGLCFFGVSQYIGQFGGNIFWNVAGSAVIQIPGTLSSIFTNQRFGRKKTLICSYLLSGISLLAIALISEESTTAKVTLSIIGIFGMSISFPTVYIFAGEIFPTVLRNTGIGLCSMSARIGSMVAPFVASLGIYIHWLPPVIFGGVPICAAFLTLLLPETHGKNLPATLKDAERFGRRRRSSVFRASETPKI